MMLRGGCSGCGSTLNRKAAGSKKNTHLDPAPLGAGARSTVRIGLSFRSFVSPEPCPLAALAALLLQPATEGDFNFSAYGMKITFSS